MRKNLFILAMLLTLPLFAQKSNEEYNTRYQLLLGKVGPAGIGVETLLENWSRDYPEDVDMLVAKFAFYFTKSQSEEVVALDQEKYLGVYPTFHLTDSLGKSINYFQVYNYDDELFRKSSEAIFQALKLQPNNLDLQLNKLDALLAYEKESPDMTKSTLCSLIDYNYSSHPVWTLGGEPVNPDTFSSGVQEYCYIFFKIASQNSYDAFKSVSERMLMYEPKNPVFMSNLGSYYLVVAKDKKQALKYYNNVLKVRPDDLTAIQNCILLARDNGDLKLEKKYLEMLAKYAVDESDKMLAQGRLTALSQKKKK